MNEMQLIRMEKAALEVLPVLVSKTDDEPGEHFQSRRAVKDALFIGRLYAECMSKEVEEERAHKDSWAIH